MSGFVGHHYAVYMLIHKLLIIIIYYNSLATIFQNLILKYRITYSENYINSEYKIKSYVV